FDEAIRVIKQIDPTRFVHFECYGIGKGNPTDFDGKMYGTPEDFAKIAQNKELTKPFYICEYAHAMFNSMGSLAEYIDVFDNNPEIVGGAIWEYQDQALWNRRDPNHPILAYGGGFGEVPNDHYFIHKGVVAWDRKTIKPHYPEMKKAYQWIATDLAEPAFGTIRIRNKFQFISLNGFDASWSLTENGVEIDKGTFSLPRIPARREGRAYIPYKVNHPKAGAEYFLRVSYTQKEKTLWADKGFEVASAQFQLPVNTLPIAEKQQQKPLKLVQGVALMTVSGEGFSIVFDKKSGQMTQLNKNGNNLLAADGAPRLHLWRAAHRNDDMWAFAQWHKFGVDSLQFSLAGLTAETLDIHTVRVVATIHATGKEGFGVQHTATYLIRGDGTIHVENDLRFTGLRINLARIGIRMLLDKKLDHLNYFGRGPIENYADRKSGADVGLYETALNDQYAYEKPMDRGNHEEVRWVKLDGSATSGLMFRSDEQLMQFTALPHTDEEMFPVEYKIDLPASKATVLCLSTRTLGVGSNGCGPRPLEKYQVWSDNTRFAYTMDLFASGK
ncbi:MAG: DUF4981 domain-containing protein, partial [Marinilabiliales bacterium]|nr:DUF4981 domain-containing protein [Marinilabiliales bacterium]